MGPDLTIRVRHWLRLHKSNLHFERVGLDAYAQERDLSFIATLVMISVPFLLSCLVLEPNLPRVKTPGVHAEDQCMNITNIFSVSKYCNGGGRQKKKSN